jgi:phosphatidylinositol 3-kinase
LVFISLAVGKIDGICCGFVQMVPNCKSIYSILQEGSITDYLKDSNEILRMKTLKTFIRSCAGYSVITYILGIGDRHLE